MLAVALTHGYLKIFSNLLCAARRNGIDNLMVFAFDATSHEYAMQNDILVVSVQAAQLQEDGENKFRTIGFQRVMLYRLQLLRAVALSGVNAVTMDTDVMPMTPQMTPQVSRNFQKSKMFAQVNSGAQENGLNPNAISGGFIGVLGNLDGAELFQRVIACHRRNIQTLENLIVTTYPGGAFPPRVYAPLTEQECFQTEFDQISPTRRFLETRILDGNRYFIENEPFDFTADYAIHHNYDNGRITRSNGWWRGICGMWMRTKSACPRKVW
jgi:hypothetical protein